MNAQKKYYYMRNGSVQGPVWASLLWDLHDKGLIEGETICEEGSERWVNFYQEFPKKKVVEPLVGEEKFVCVLRRESEYKVARVVVRVTTTLVCIGVVTSWLSLFANGEISGWSAILAAGLAVLLFLSAIGSMQLLEAILDGADALVRLAEGAD